MSILRSLYESENYINENINLDYVLNNYRSVIESLEVTGNPIKYDARMVPIIKDSLDGQTFSYLIPLEDVIRLSKNDIISMAEAVEKIIEVNNEAAGETALDKDNTKIVITDADDADDLEEACKKDPTKLKAKVKKVEEFTEIINQLQEAGYKVVKNY